MRAPPAGPALQNMGFGQRHHVSWRNEMTKGPDDQPATPVSPPHAPLSAVRPALRTTGAVGGPGAPYLPAVATSVGMPPHSGPHGGSRVSPPSFGRTSFSMFGAGQPVAAARGVSHSGSRISLSHMEPDPGMEIYAGKALGTPPQTAGRINFDFKSLFRSSMTGAGDVSPASSAGGDGAPAAAPRKRDPLEWWANFDERVMQPVFGGPAEEAAATAQKAASRRASRSGADSDHDSVSRAVAGAGGGDGHRHHGHHRHKGGSKSVDVGGMARRSTSVPDLNALVKGGVRPTDHSVATSAATSVAASEYSASAAPSGRASPAPGMTDSSQWGA